MQIAPHNGQRDIALEALDAVIPTDVQAVVLQRIDGRLDGGGCGLSMMSLRGVCYNLL
jgi:hypothetical protein